MVTKQEIVKGKKYMFQFPDGTPTEKKQEYIQKVNDAFEKGDIVSIDSKVRVLERDYVAETIEEEVKNDNTNGKDSGDADATKNTEASDDSTVVPTSDNKISDATTSTDDKKTDSKEPSTKVESKPSGDSTVSVEKVEVNETPKEPEVTAKTVYFGSEE